MTVTIQYFQLLSEVMGARNAPTLEQREGHMGERYYPPLPGEVLVVLKLVKTDPDYLDDPECPYDDDLKVVLQGAAEGNVVTLDTVEREVQRLYDELTQFGKDLDKEDAAEKNTYFRLSVGLLEKLLELKEKALNLKNLREFQNTVIAAMEDELSPDQRTRVMARLKNQ